MDPDEAGPSHAVLPVIDEPTVDSPLQSQSTVDLDYSATPRISHSPDEPHHSLSSTNPRINRRQSSRTPSSGAESLLLQTTDRVISTIRESRAVTRPHDGLLQFIRECLEGTSEERRSEFEVELVEVCLKHRYNKG